MFITSSKKSTDCGRQNHRERRGVSAGVWSSGPGAGSIIRSLLLSLSHSPNVTDKNTV